ncbi:MAG: right-handed parallel beta-helix repeat-containing protein [Deltaproteobacteria bacterium]|nr:right-handed parallel beta-helix repeat-containing protein [Deltaproteobacteria bacterium]
MILNRRQFLAYTGAAAAGALLLPRSAFAATTLSSFPVTITLPGSYVIAANHNLNLSLGAAITVEADDVDINFQGFSISNSAAGLDTAAVGVYAILRNRVRVRNGTLERFHTGVMLMGSQNAGGSIVEDLTLTDCTASGILLSGAACIVQRNVMSFAERTTLFCTPPETAILGIGLSRSPRSRVIDNVISFTNTGADDLAIALYAGQNCDELICLDNQLTGADVGFVIDEALDASAEMRDTATTSVTTKSWGGTDLDTL